MIKSSGKSTSSNRKTALLGAASLVAGASLFAFAAPAMAEKNGMMDRHKAHLEEVDTDKNGKISRAEADAARDKHFTEADADGDGSVSFEEFQAMAEKHRQMMLKRRFERSDKNNDGVLTGDELGGRFADHFERMDKNGDGEISAEERKKAHKKMRKHRMHDKEDH